MRTTTCVMAFAWLGLLAACGADSSDPGGRKTGGKDPNDPFANAGGTGAGGSAGTFGNTTGASGGGGGDKAGSGAAGSGSGSKKDCATAEVKPSRVTPIINIVVDGSGSMCADYSGQPRWQALRSALLDPAAGLIKRLEGQVEFGMVLYDGTINAGLAAGSSNPPCASKYVGPKATGMCPQLVEVAPAAMNFTPIDTAYPQTELGGSTPTDKAMMHVMDQMIPAAMMDPDPKNHPRYVILATDGKPNDICMGGAGGDGSANRAEVITQVMRGVQAGVQTYVISLAGGDADLQMHLDAVVAAGGTGTMAFSPMTKDDLVMTLAQIIGGAIGCQVILNGEVTAGMECKGYVEVNGMPLTCNDPDGWHLLDSKTIELTGKACMDFMTNPDAALEAGFPCGVFRPL